MRLISFFLILLLGATACAGQTSHSLFPTIPGDTSLPPSWAADLYEFYPRDGTRHIGLNTSITIKFGSYWHDRDDESFLPAQIGLETYCFGWTAVRTELSPLSPYEWRLDPGSGSLSPDSKYRIWVTTRNGWMYSAVFWTGDESGDDDYWGW